MADTVLSIQDLSVRIGDAVLLQNISFSIRTGERVSLIGPNGAGKTTLLKCLTRIHTQYTGAITLQGIPLPTLKQKELARLMSWVPQGEGDAPPFRVEEFVTLGRYCRLKPFVAPSPEDRAKVESALTLCGLEEFRSRTLATLSGGERQKVHIAAALAQDAPLMLLDEPTTFLDPRQSMEIEDLLFELHQRAKRTLLVVTHDINRALLESDRVLGLKQGKLLFDLPPEKLIEGTLLDELFDRQKRPFIKAVHPGLNRLFIVPDTVLGNLPSGEVGL